jgi:hypothetical protein
MNLSPLAGVSYLRALERGFGCLFDLLQRNVRLDDSDPRQTENAASTIK